VTDLDVQYDSGSFDKDEQGWCARRVEITTEGDRVTIRYSGDDNGARPYDYTVTATIGPRWPELGLTALVDQGRTIAYFDAKTRRLRAPGEQVVRWFKAPPGHRAPGCLERAAALIAPIAAALGMRPGAPPTAEAVTAKMPPLTPSPTAGGATESNLKVPGERGCVWSFMLRDYPADNPLGPQFHVQVEGDGGLVLLFAGESARAMALFTGPLERHALARTARDRALADWAGLAPEAPHK
jgi:hypothetical protein